MTKEKRAAKNKKQAATPTKKNPVVAIDAEYVRQTAALAEPVAIALNNITTVLNQAIQSVMTPAALNQNIQQIVQVAERLKRLENFKG